MLKLDYHGEQLAPRPRYAATAEMLSGERLHALVERVREFQLLKFPNQSLDAKLAHLGREVGELRKAPADAMEWADVVILLLGAASKDGRTIDDLIAAANAKMEINERRQWAAPDNEGVYHHMEER